MENRTMQSWKSWRFTALICTGTLGVLFLSSGCVRSPEAKEARYLESGKRQFEKKDYARAAIQFINAAKAMPKDAEPHYQLALAYLAQRQYQRALGSLDTAIKLNPNHAQAKLKLAEMMILSNKK